MTRKVILLLFFIVTAVHSSVIHFEDSEADTPSDTRKTASPHKPFQLPNRILNRTDDCRYRIMKMEKDSIARMTSCNENIHTLQELYTTMQEELKVCKDLAHLRSITDNSNCSHVSKFISAQLAGETRLYNRCKQRVQSLEMQAKSQSTQCGKAQFGFKDRRSGDSESRRSTSTTRSPANGDSSHSLSNDEEDSSEAEEELLANALEIINKQKDEISALRQQLDLITNECSNDFLDFIAENGIIPLKFNGKNYIIYDGDAFGDFTWEEASSFCHLAGFELASIETFTENDGLFDRINALIGPDEDEDSAFWISGRDPDNDGDYEWEGTGSYDFLANFGTPTTSGLCLAMEDVSTDANVVGVWEEEACDLPARFICEMESTACNRLL